MGRGYFKPFVCSIEPRRMYLHNMHWTGCRSETLEETVHDTTAKQWSGMYFYPSHVEYKYFWTDNYTLQNHI